MSRDLILWVSVSSLEGLVSVSRFKGLGLARGYSIETSVLVSDFRGVGLGRGGHGFEWSGLGLGLGLG